MSMENGGRIMLQDRDVFHIHGMGFQGYTSQAIAEIGREAIGGALGAQRHSAAYFGNGAISSGVLKVPTQLQPETYSRLRKAFDDRHAGSENAYRPIVLEGDADWHTISPTPDETQLVETREFGVEEIARWFRIPPHKIQHLKRSTFSNIEQQGIEYVQDTLMPWMVRSSPSATVSCSEENKFFAKHVVQGLLRGDQAARSQFYSSQFNIGALSQNDIRELEDMNPIGPEGDVYYVPLNMQPSDMAAMGPEPPSPPPPDTMAEDGDGEDMPPPDGESDARKLRQLDAIERSFRDRLESCLGRSLMVIADKSRRKASNGESLRRWIESFFPDGAPHFRGLIGPPIDDAVSLMLSAMGHGEMDDCWAELCVDLAKRLSEDISKRCRNAVTARPRAPWSRGRAIEEADRIVAEVADLVARLDQEANGVEHA